MKQLYFLFLIIGAVSGGFCDGGSVSASASSEALAVGGGSAVSTANAEAVLSFNEHICGGDVNAAANSLSLAIGSGSDADFAATALAFSEAAEHDVSVAADALAVAFKGKDDGEALDILKTIRLSYEKLGSDDAFDAAAIGYGKAVGNGDLGGEPVALCLLSGEMTPQKEALTMAAVDGAVSVNCDNLKQVLTDAWAIAQTPEMQDIKKLILEVADAYECVQGCCV